MSASQNPTKQTAAPKIACQRICLALGEPVRMKFQRLVHQFVQRHDNARRRFRVTAGLAHTTCSCPLWVGRGQRNCRPLMANSGRLRFDHAAVFEDRLCGAFVSAISCSN